MPIAMFYSVYVACAPSFGVRFVGYFELGVILIRILLLRKNIFQKKFHIFQYKMDRGHQFI